MDFVGLLIVLAGAWLIDSGVQNRSPLSTLKTILRDPQATRTALKSGVPIYAPSSGGTGSTSGVSTGLATPSASQGASQGAAQAIAYARAQIGKPYKWATSGPDTFDCSGLVMRAWEAGGYKLSRTTYTMLADARLTTVSRDSLIPGDLVFPDAGHVQIYTGNGMVVEAPRSGLTVREVAMWGWLTARRVPGQGSVST